MTQRVTAATRAEIKERASGAIKNEDAQDRWIGIGAFTVLDLLADLDDAEKRVADRGEIIRENSVAAENAITRLTAENATQKASLDHLLKINGQLEETRMRLTADLDDAQKSRHELSVELAAVRNELEAAITDWEVLATNFRKQGGSPATVWRNGVQYPTVEDAIAAAIRALKPKDSQ